MRRGREPKPTTARFASALSSPTEHTGCGAPQAARTRTHARSHARAQSRTVKHAHMHTHIVTYARTHARTHAQVLAALSACCRGCGRGVLRLTRPEPRRSSCVCTPRGMVAHPAWCPTRHGSPRGMVGSGLGVGAAAHRPHRHGTLAATCPVASYKCCVASNYSCHHAARADNTLQTLVRERAAAR